MIPLRGSDVGGTRIVRGICRIRAPIRAMDNRRSLMDDGGGWKETQPWHDQRALGGHGHKINM
jgi:hypothetical protein